MLLFFHIVIFESKLCANNARDNKNKSNPCLAATCFGKHKISSRPEKSIFPKEKRLFLPGEGNEVTMHMVLALWTYPQTSLPQVTKVLMLPWEGQHVKLCSGQSGTV